ncbi:protein mono-ADP-ribosyltransferase PARP14 [Oryzias melastigma]|uniref:protein mono-ADP-ribosyltransferase PARP14 n=1 Tax=Oryzias melastigma TaxID=30732 RepID=UPI000CF7F559|nr:protein mono-ADP-ribosyltransferase PARP14 [Oryzias melastigma]
MECTQIVSAQSLQPRPMIMTTAGQLPSKHIIHIVSQNSTDYIRQRVVEVLKLSEKNRFTSVAFPALGTGQGGVNPSAVADAMVDAVVEFVRKETPQCVQSVKILIFQTEMMSHFHNSMRKRQGEEVQEKGFLGKIKDTVTSWFRSEPGDPADVRLQKEEFDPVVFQLCAENQQTVNEAKKRITQLIVNEQAKRTITDPYIRQLSQTHMEELNNLQKRLTVRINLETGREEEETKIHLEGLTRDVSEAEAEIRDIIRKVERSESLKNKAILVSGLVEWQYQNPSGSTVPFDIYMNLKLEEALEKKQQVKIQINNRDFDADPEQRKASDGRNFIELLRKDLKEPENPLPSHWDDMKNDIVKLVPVAAGSQEHTDVTANLTQSGLSLTIISIERVQNSCLWQSFQLLKKQMEHKNKHSNNEKVLFHGTSADSIDLINTKGFNRSYAGRNGAVYGNGSYFAVNPAYSAKSYAKPDNQGLKRMYQARVLVGDFTQGSSGLIVPPPKSGQSTDLYDSVTDNKNPPSMFVVFNDIQAYPEYLITFT